MAGNLRFRSPQNMPTQELEKKTKVYLKIRPDLLYEAPTMILLMGIKINLTKKPTNPITTNPIAVLVATFVNSNKKHQKNIPFKRN